jgi:hypothetical protein
MKRTIATAALTAMMGAPTSAQERDAAFKAAATHIVTAHECEKVTGKRGRKAKAVDIQRERLVASGYEPEKADATIAEINNYLKDDATQLTEEMCASLLTMMEK